MASTYVQVTIEQMREKLKATKGWTEKVIGNEIVFDFPIKSQPGVVIRVFSSIKAFDHQAGLGRGKGKDAIRVCAFNQKTERGILKSKRVYRTTNWRDNLEKKVFSAFEYLTGKQVKK